MLPSILTPRYSFNNACKTYILAAIKSKSFNIFPKPTTENFVLTSSTLLAKGNDFCSDCPV